MLVANAELAWRTPTKGGQETIKLVILRSR
jgi:hypothetical protein